MLNFIHKLEDYQIFSVKSLTRSIIGSC